MLTDLIAETFIKRSIVKKGTKIESFYETVDPFSKVIRKKDIFLLESVKKKEDKLKFKLFRVTDGFETTVTSKDIVKLDGMYPKDVAKAFSIAIQDGQKIQNGKRRGRPRKYFRSEEERKEIVNETTNPC